MLVVDASVLAPTIADQGIDGDRCRAAIRSQVLAAPDLLKLEVLSVLRRRAARGLLTARQARNAVDDLRALPVSIYPTAALLSRCWELRGNVSAYDATYIALAEQLGCAVVTCDAKLANAPGPRCQIEIVLVATNRSRSRKTASDRNVSSGSGRGTINPFGSQAHN